MQKTFLSNLILLVLVNLIIKPLTIIGVDTEVQNRMGTTDFGLYFSLFNFTTIFNILLDLGINNFTTRNVAQHPHLLKKYMGSTLILRLILSLIYLVACSLVGLSIGYGVELVPLILLFGLQQITYSLISYSRSYLSGLLLFKQDAFLSVLDKSLILITCGTLMYSGIKFDFTIQSYITIQLTCNSIASFIAVFLMMRQVRKTKFVWRKPLFHYIIKESLPYALFIVLMMLYTRLDSVMIERIHWNGAYESGVYAQGFRLVDAGFMFAMLFGSLLLPIFSRIYKQKEESARMIRVAGKLLIWSAVAISIFVYFQADYILNLLYDEVSPNGVTLFRVQFFTFTFMCGSVIYGTFLTGIGDMRLLNKIGLTGLVVNLIFNFLLIPDYGALGAAIATICTQGAVTIIQWYSVKNYIQVNIDWRHVGLFGFFVLFVFGVGLFLKEVDFGWFYHLTVIALSLFVFKVFDIKTFYTMIRAKNE